MANPFSASGLSDAAYRTYQLQGLDDSAIRAKIVAASAPRPTTQNVIAPPVVGPTDGYQVVQSPRTTSPATSGPAPVFAPPPRLDMPEGAQPGAADGEVDANMQALSQPLGGFQPGQNPALLNPSAGVGGSTIATYAPTLADGTAGERQEQVKNPDGSITTVPLGTDAYTFSQMTPEQRITAQILGASLGTRDSNRSAVLGAAGASAAQSAATNQTVDQMRWDQLARQQSLVGTAAQGDQQALGLLAGGAGQANARDEAVIGQQAQMLGMATAADQGALANLQGAGIAATGQNNANLGMYADQLGQISQRDQATAADFTDRATSYENLQAADWGGDLQSQAATTQADAGAIAAQRQGLGQYSDASRGALDVNSALENVYGDAGSAAAQQRALGQMEDVAGGSLNQGSALSGVYGDRQALEAQRGAMSQMQLIGQGSQDISSQAAYATPHARDMEAQRQASQRLLTAANGGDDLTSRLATSGSLDITSAAEGVTPDAKAVAAQGSFLDRYIADSDPSMSATERFMLEQNRRTEEQDRSSAMAGKMREMQARGMLGSGDEIAAMLGAQSTTSQNRQMADLAAMANAQQRAERQQAQGTALAGSMRGSSFGEGMDVANSRDAMATGNRGALMAQLGAGDEFALGNRATALTAANQAGALGTQMRNQGMSEALARGTAADQTAAGNRDARMDALGVYGDQASNLSAQSFQQAATRAGGTDDANIANRNVVLEGLGAYGDYATGLQDQGFQQAAVRASATDATAQTNADRQMQALAGYTDAAGGMRSSSFAEGMATGSAADQFAQFNRTGSLSQQNYNTELQRQQQDAEWNRIAAATGVQLGVNDSQAQRSGSVYDAARGVTDANYGYQDNQFNASTGVTDAAVTRNENLGGMALDANQSSYGRIGDVASATSNAANANYVKGTAANADYTAAISDFSDRAKQQRDETMNYTGLYTGQGTRDNAGVTDAYKLQLAAIEAKKAQDALKPDEGIIPDDIPILGGFL